MIRALFHCMVTFASLFTSGCMPFAQQPDEPADFLVLSISPGPTPNDPSAPLFESVVKYTTTISANGDLTDVYVPDSAGHDSAECYPIALLLQGANVDKSFYSGFAATVAAHGFVVVVPNHVGLFGLGLFAELSEIADVLRYMAAENSEPASPVAGMVDATKVVLIGHSHGGAAALTAAWETCAFPFCLGDFARPPELCGVVVYGTALCMPSHAELMAVLGNGDTPIAVMRGELDSIASFRDVAETFDDIQDRPKAFVTVCGANHFGINDVNSPPGTVVDVNSPTVSQQESVRTIAHWSAIFLRAYVLGDAGALDYLRHASDGDVSIVLEE